MKTSWLGGVFLLCIAASYGGDIAPNWGTVREDTVKHMKYVSGVCHVMKRFINMTGPLGDMIAKETNSSALETPFDELVDGYLEAAAPVTDFLEKDFNVTMMELVSLMETFLNETMGEQSVELGDVMNLVKVFVNMTEVMISADDSFGEVMDGFRGTIDDMMGDVDNYGDMIHGLKDFLLEEFGEMMCNLMEKGGEFADEVIGKGLIGGGNGGRAGRYMMTMMDVGMDMMDEAAVMYDGLLEMAEEFGCPGDKDGPLAIFGNMTGTWYDMIDKFESFVRVTASGKMSDDILNLYYDKLKMVAFFANMTETVSGIGGGPSANVTYLMTSLMMGDMDGADRALHYLEMSYKMGTAGTPGELFKKMNDTAELIMDMLEHPDGVVDGLMNGEKELTNVLGGLKQDIDSLLEDVDDVAGEAIGMLEDHAEDLWGDILSMGENMLGVVVKEAVVHFRNMSRPWEQMKKEMDDFFKSTDKLGGLFGCDANIDKKIGNQADAWIENPADNSTVIGDMEVFVKEIEDMLLEHGDIVISESMTNIAAVSHLTRGMHHGMKVFLGSMSDYIGCGLDMTTGLMEPNYTESWDDMHEFKRLVGNMTHEMGHKLGVLIGHRCNMMSLRHMMRILMRINMMAMQISEIQSIQANMIEMMWTIAEKNFDRFIDSHGITSLGEFLEGEISDAVVRKLTPDMVRGMTHETLAIVGRHMPAQAIDALCETMVKYGDGDLLQTMYRQGIDCLSSLANKPGFEVDDGAAHALLENLLGPDGTSGWDKESWKTALTVSNALGANDVKDMDTDVVKDLLRDGAVSHDTFKDNPSAQSAFNDKLVAAYGKPKKWSDDDLREMGVAVINLNTDQMKSLDASAVAANLDVYRNATFNDKKREAAFTVVVFEALGGVSSANTWTSDDIINSAKYAIKNSRLLAGLDKDNLLDSVEAFEEHVTDKRDAVTLAKTLVAGSSEFSDPKSVSSDLLKKLGKSTCGLQTSYLGALSGSALEQSVDDINSGDYSRSQAREMMNKLQKRGVFDPTSMTKDDIERAGTFIKGLDAREVAQFPPTSVNESLETLGDMDFSKDQGRALVKQLKSLMGGDFSSADQTLNARQMKKLFKFVRRSELGDLINAGHLDFDCAADSLDIDVDGSQAAMIMAKIREQFGSPANTNTNYTSSCFAVWGKIAAMGISPQDIADLREDDEMPSIIEKFSAFADRMTEAQILKVVEKIRNKYATNASQASVVDNALAAQLAPFMAHLSDSELEYFNVTIRPTIIKGLAKSNTHCLPRADITRLKKFALKNVLRDDTDEVTDRTSASELDDNDIRELGYLICGLEANDMAKLNLEAIENNLGSFAVCIYSTEVGSALMDRALALSPDMFDSFDNLVIAGHLLTYLNSDNINALSQETLADGFLDLADSFDDFDEVFSKRDESYSVETSAEQRAADREARVAIFQIGLNALASTSASRRRRSLRPRRATNAVSCTDIQSMGGSVIALSVDDIVAIEEVDFQDCLETLGAESDWTDEQLTALADQAKAVLDAVSSWSEEETRQAGSIIAGLTSAEISSLPLSSADVMSSIGSHDLYDSAQLDSGYSRWLSLTQSDSITNVDSDELNSLGHFACGIGTEDIADIAAAIYLDAASSIGSLTTCEESQLAAFAALAKDDDAFGSDVTAWDSSTISAVGSVIGGLTKPEIASLSQTQIQSLTPSTISQIPPSNFAGFSVTQIGYFTTSQASAVTESQQAALSLDQLLALQDAGATVQAIGNAATALQPMLVALVASFLYMLL